MPRKIVVLDGHPDKNEKRFCHILADAYVEGAKEAGHEVKLIRVSETEFPLITCERDFGNPLTNDISNAQEAIKWADHMVIIHPMWMGTMPAKFHAFTEQVFRKDVAWKQDKGKFPEGLMHGRSARVIMTMGMPVIIYRYFYFAHSLRAMKRNMLKFMGYSPVKDTLFGMIDSVSDEKRKSWIEKVRALGREGK